MINTLLEHVPIKMEVKDIREESTDQPERKDKMDTGMANDDDEIDETDEDIDDEDDEEDLEDEEEEEESDTETEALEIEQEATMLISSDEEAELEAQRIRFPDIVAKKLRKDSNVSSTRSSSRNSQASSNSSFRPHITYEIVHRKSSITTTSNTTTIEEAEDKRQTAISPCLTNNSENNKTLESQSKENNHNNNNNTQTLLKHKITENKTVENNNKNKTDDISKRLDSNKILPAATDSHKNSEIICNKENLLKSPISNSGQKSRRGSNNSTCSVASTVASDSAETESCGNIYVFNLQQKLIFNCEFCDLKYGDLENFARHLNEVHKLFNFDEDPEKENAPRNLRKSNCITTNGAPKNSASVKKEPLQCLELVAEPPVALPPSVLAEPLDSCGNVFMLNHRKLFLVCGYCECKYANLELFEKHLRQQHRIFEGFCNELNVVPKVEVKEEVFITNEMAGKPPVTAPPVAMVEIPAEIPLNISMTPENETETLNVVEQTEQSSETVNKEQSPAASLPPAETKSLEPEAVVKEKENPVNVEQTSELVNTETASPPPAEIISLEPEAVAKEKEEPANVSEISNTKEKKILAEEIVNKEVPAKVSHSANAAEKKSLAEEIVTKEVAAKVTQLSKTAEKQSLADGIVNNEYPSPRKTRNKRPSSTVKPVAADNKRPKRSVRSDSKAQNEPAPTSVEEKVPEIISETAQILEREKHFKTLPTEKVPEKTKKCTKPEGSKEISLPEESKDVSLPADSKEVSLPGESKEVSLPEESKEDSLAKESKKVSLPKESKKVPLPEVRESTKESKKGKKPKKSKETKKTGTTPVKIIETKETRGTRKSSKATKTKKPTTPPAKTAKEATKVVRSKKKATAEKPATKETKKSTKLVEIKKIKEEHPELETEIETNNKSKLKCSTCFKEFSRKDTLKIHERTHTSEKPYECDICHKSFGDRTNLYMHKKCHMGDSCKKYKCDICDKKFLRNTDRKVHMASHTGEKSFKCGICMRAYSSRISVKKHIDRDHIEAKLKKKSARKENLLSTKVEPIIPTLIEPKQVTQLPQEDNLIEDLTADPFEEIIEQLQNEMMENERRNQKVTSAVTYTIIEMSKSELANKPTEIEITPIAIDPQLNDDIDSTGDDIKPPLLKVVKRFFCDVCPRTFEKRIRLVEHKRTHTGEKPFGCDECGKHFRIRMRLNEHKLRHSKEKKFKCEVCQLACYTKHDLNLHMRHHNDRRYQCLMCPKAFVRNSDLKIHVRVHTGEKPYVCDICHKCFRANQNLCVHKKSHMGEASKTYKCERCDKKFMRNIDRKVHMRSHTGEKPFKCEICQRGYSSKFNVRAHIEKYHISANGVGASPKGKKKPGPKPRALREELEKQKKLIEDLQNQLLQQIKTDEKIIPADEEMLQEQDTLQDSTITTATSTNSPLISTDTSTNVDTIQSAYELLNKLKSTTATSKPLTIIPSPPPMAEPPSNPFTKSKRDTTTTLPLTITQKLEQPSPAASSSASSSASANSASCLTTPSPPRATTATKVVSQKTSLGIQQVSVTVSMQVENVTPNSTTTEKENAANSPSAANVKKERKITSYFTVLGQKTDV